MTLAMLAVLGTSLSGCIVEIPTPTMDVSTGIDRLPRDETGPWTYRDPTEKELLLSRSDFSVELVRFTDSRTARSMEGLSEDQLVQTYDPDTLVGGVTYVVPNMIEKYLSYRPRMPKNYKVEIELTRLVTVIKKGTFWSGSWGRYNVEAEVAVIARRPDSSVVLQKNFRYHEEQPREDYNGRGPSMERDRVRMFDLTSSIMRKVAEDIGWNLRQRDARTWKVAAPEVIPTGLNLPPRASGNADVDTQPVRLMPVGDSMMDSQAHAPVDTVMPPAVPATPPTTPASGWVPDTQGTPAPELPPVEDGTMGPVI